MIVVMQQNDSNHKSKYISPEQGDIYRR